MSKQNKSIIRNVYTTSQNQPTKYKLKWGGTAVQSPAIEKAAAKKFLYHGTRYLGLIAKEQCLRIPKVGYKHISLTSEKSVARYWARIPRYNVLGFGYIITLDYALLEKDGYNLSPFLCPMSVIEEHEIACSKNIEDIWRYVVAIERVARSEFQLNELIKYCGKILKFLTLSRVDGVNKLRSRL